MEVGLEDLVARLDEVVALTGTDSYVDWEEFTRNQNASTTLLDRLIKKLITFKENHQREFLTAIKKTKSHDVPNVVKLYREKKLPKEALRNILPNLKLVEGKLQLDAASLRQAAQASAADFNKKNLQVTGELSATEGVLDKLTELQITVIQASKDEKGPAPTYKFPEDKLVQIAT
jgi:hypothetical protein